jgi:membrane-anchored glycerophosphoryl diester phosphodiesterase (GDPDase)
MLIALLESCFVILPLMIRARIKTWTAEEALGRRVTKTKKRRKGMNWWLFLRTIYNGAFFSLPFVPQFFSADLNAPYP